ncbi:hypothetical protein, partial [Bradyrhizobium sp. cir1]|uniref:hypothetical protein n=1 Tax=Bradyrhizobium sp. cir1 TaxID=1445730 RepID=UPI001AED2B00
HLPSFHLHRSAHPRLYRAQAEAWRGVGLMPVTGKRIASASLDLPDRRGSSLSPRSNSVATIAADFTWRDGIEPEQI